MSSPEKNSEMSGTLLFKEMSCLIFQPKLRAPPQAITTYKTYHSSNGMIGMQSMPRRPWYAKYALICTGFYWYAQHKNVVL